MRGDALPGDVECRTVVYGGPDEGQAQVGRYALLKSVDLDRDVPLVVVHAQRNVVPVLDRLVEDDVRRHRADGVDAFGLSLPEYAFYGGYPGASDLISEPPKWRRYVRSALIETTIERDVVGVARIEKPALLKQLFELGAAYSGQILAIEKILGLLAGAGNASTVVDYLHLLSRVGLLTAIPRYSRSPARQRTDRPKLLVLNTGLMTALSDYSFEEAQADRTFWGRIVETAAGAHLLNTADERTKVYYWRNKDGDEVDFVMTRGPRTVAIEVKTGKARTTRGMQLFKERFSPDRSVVVTSDEREPNSVSFGEYFARPASDWFEHGE